MSGKAIAFAAGLCVASAAQAAYISNGTFEALTGNATGQTFENWTESGDVATVATTGIDGNSARMAKVGDNNSLYQNVVDPNKDLTKFTFSVDFAMSDPGGAGDRGLNVNLRPGTASPAAGQINLRVVDVDADGDGDLQAFNSTTWVTILADSVVFSASETDLVVNTLTVEVDYTTPGYTVTVGNGTPVTVNHFHGAVPADASLVRVAFETGNLATGAFYVIDNVNVVPEPASLSLLGLGAVALMRRRRR